MFEVPTSDGLKIHDYAMTCLICCMQYADEMRERERCNDASPRFSSIDPVIAKRKRRGGLRSLYVDIGSRKLCECMYAFYEKRERDEYSFREMARFGRVHLFG
jgi:hypothetical protein